TFSKNLSAGEKSIHIKALTEEEQGAFTDIQILLAKASTFQKHFAKRIKDSGRSIHVLETTINNCGKVVSKCKRASFVVFHKSHPCNEPLSPDCETLDLDTLSPFAIVKNSAMEELSLKET